jgi:hypothetical protein
MRLQRRQTLINPLKQLRLLNRRRDRHPNEGPRQPNIRHHLTILPMEVQEVAPIQTEPRRPDLPQRRIRPQDIQERLDQIKG